jgi:LacI family transcriptional regulator
MPVFPETAQPPTLAGVSERPQNGRGPVTIKSIAEAAGVSRGTVDRALNDRGDVNSVVAARIRSLAQEMGYSPNRAAKALRFNFTPKTIRAFLPDSGGGFFDGLVEGVREAQGDFTGMGIHAEVVQFDPRNQHALLALLDEIRPSEPGVDGLIVTGPDSPEVRNALARLIRAGMPIVTVNSDIRVPGRLCFVGQDLERSGVVAAELMAKILPQPGRVFAVTGNLRYQAHRDRIGGFRQGMGEWAPACEVVVLEGFDVYDLTRKVLQESFAGVDHRTVGIYMATGNVEAMLDVVRANPGMDRVRVVTNDAVPAVRAGLSRREIDFTILQDERHQGSVPVRIIAEFLLSGTRPEPWFRSPIHVVGATHLSFEK